MRYKGLPMLSFFCFLTIVGKYFNLLWLEKFSYIGLFFLSGLTLLILGMAAIKYWRQFPPFNIATESIFVEWDSFGLIVVAVLAGFWGWRDISCMMIVSWIFLVYCRGKEYE